MDDRQFKKKLAAVIAQCDQGLLEFSRVRAGLSRTLVSLEPHAAACGALSIELGTVNYYAGVLLVPSDPENSLARLEHAIAVQEATPFLTREREWVARLEIAANHVRLGNTSAGLAKFADLRRRIDTAADVGNDLRINTLHRIGYYLHEGGLFAAALEHNERLLASICGWVGTANRFTLDTQRNLAENHYSLGNLEQAQRWLSAVITSAQHLSEPAICSEAHFKLGVLAHERGAVAEAQAHMQRGLAVAETSNDADLIAQARWRLEELARRTAGGSPDPSPP